MPHRNLLPLKAGTLTLFLGLLVFYPTAQAEITYKGTYWGGQFGSQSAIAETPTVYSSTDRSYGMVKYGWLLNDRWSAEVQMALSSGSPSDKGFFNYAAYAKPYWDKGPYRLYGLAGLGGFQLATNSGSKPAVNSFSYGAGLELFGSKQLAVTMEWARIAEGEDASVDYTTDKYSFGLTYYFLADDSFTKNRRSIRSIRP